MPVLTVSQINRYISFRFKEDKNIQGIMVKGEISNFVEHYRSGHLYFTLKDGESAIKAVMFASAAARLRFSPEDGMSVIVSGSVSVFERDGVYQLYVTDIQPDGAGAVSIALEQLKKKLSKEGIFDTAHKRPVPVMPKKIGAVTSLSGAAVRDIVNVLSRRYPIGELYCVNALVQGENAPESVCRGIMKAESLGCDVIIVGRGGGSSEDLSAFNSEKVAYAIYNCKVPVISAVGHETNFSIADLAADLRAPTPSAAAELSVPSVENLAEKLNICERRIRNAALRKLDSCTDGYIALNARLTAQSPENRMKLAAGRLDGLSERLKNSYGRYTSNCDKRLGELAVRLDMLSPLKVLSRGYSLVYHGERLINDAEKLKSGDTVKIRFGSGEHDAVIK
ncbi:MAG: exodeoxyribonuclease VII large subunit [Oscillospiraceae bacterium]|nr:exodeoxyribonuclease VII large subunit [Oscillospiraceae bacterium]